MINKSIKLILVMLLAFSSLMCAKSYDTLRSEIEHAQKPKEIALLAKYIADADNLGSEEKTILLARLAKHTIALATESLEKAYNSNDKIAKKYLDESWEYIKENKKLLTDADPEDLKEIIKELSKQTKDNFFK